MGTGSGIDPVNGGWGDRKDFWEFDPETNEWTQKADFGGRARHGSVGFAINSKGYIGTGSYDEQPSYYFIDNLWEYDPATNEWTQKSSMGDIGRSEAVSFVIDGKAYVGTGTTRLDRAQYTSRLDDLWEYDPTSDEWMQLGDFPGEPTYGATALVIGGKGYLGFGRGSYNTFWECNPADDKWTQKGDFEGEERSEAFGFSLNGKGYLGCGYGGSGLKYYNDFYEYNPETDVWKQLGNAGSEEIIGRSDAVTFTINGVGYTAVGRVLRSGQLTSGYETEFRKYVP